MATEKAKVKAADEATIETFRAIDLAKSQGMLAAIPGSRLRPSVENPEAWKYRAAKLRFGFGDEDQMTETEFSARIAAVSTVLVR